MNGFKVAVFYAAGFAMLAAILTGILSQVSFGPTGPGAPDRPDVWFSLKLMGGAAITMFALVLYVTGGRGV